MLPPKGQFEELAKLLESGEAIPDDLAISCAAAIRTALSNNGKLPLRGRGRPPIFKESFIRASEVETLISKKGMTRESAIEEISRKCSRDIETVKKNYDKHRPAIKRFDKSVRSASLDLHILDHDTVTPRKG